MEPVGATYAWSFRHKQWFSIPGVVSTQIARKIGSIQAAVRHIGVTLLA